MPSNLLVTHVGLPEGDQADILIEDGVIVRVGAGLDVGGDVTRLDGAGRKVFPGFVDGHSHMDKTLIGMPWRSRKAGRSQMEMIADERALRTSPEWDYDRQISRHIEAMVAAGTLYTRAFVDIDTDAGLMGFEAMMRAKKKYSGVLDMQIVAFGQSGIQVRPGTEELIEEAAARGADFIGGMDPCQVERDPVRHIDWLFATARKYGVGVDVHVHERGDMGLFSAELIIDRTRRYHMEPGTVMISHPHFLGDVAPDRAASVVADMADLGIMATDNAQASGPMASLVQFQDAGVVVTSGCDGIEDSWGPMNHSDMLFKGYQLAWRHGLGADEELQRVLDVITYGGARAMKLPKYGVREGSPADLVLVDVDAPVRAIVEFPKERTVIKSGRVVADAGKYLL